MKRIWAIIGVSNVPAQLQMVRVAPRPAGDPSAHEDFGRILDTDETVLVCLHEWGAHEHPSLMSPD
jgi:hypothetical protein